MSKKLWVHQEQAVEATVKAVKKRGRAQCIMACGTGKTRVEIETAGRLMRPKASRVAVLVPSLALVKQAIEDWRQDAGFDFHPLAVCSRLDKRAEDEAQVEWGALSPTSRPDDIHGHLGGKGARVVFATYASSRLLEGMPVDLAIYDEAHRTAGDLRKPWSSTLRPGFFLARCEAIPGWVWEGPYGDIEAALKKEAESATQSKTKAGVEKTGKKR